MLLLANAFTAGIGFLTTITIANTLGSARFGQLAYAIAFGDILAVNVRFGIDHSLIRDLVHYPEGFQKTLAASLLARSLLLAVCIAGLLLALVALPSGILEISWGMLLVILAAVLQPLQIDNVFDVWEIQGRHAIYLCVERGAYFSLIWAVVFLAPHQLHLMWIGSARFMSTLLFLFLQYRYAWYKLKPNFKCIPLCTLTRTALALLASNKWLWLASVAALGMSSSNNIILKHFTGFSDLGVYAASFQLVSMANLLTKNITRIGRPILARYTDPKVITANSIIRFLTLYVAIGIIAISIIALPAIVFPKIILQTLFTPEYASGFWILRLFGFYMLFGVVTGALTQYVVLIRMDKIYLFANVKAGLVSFVCALILIPYYAGVGAALALLIGEVAIIIIYFVTFSISISRIKRVQSRKLRNERIAPAN